ncbi:MAG: YsnF/AvaK domain-containing protein [Methylibium sp.]|uniref:YsnF/AvaK domain-containing protein n=1 Tax=Methylibium sp. TaxID=2067992 RepID=UPI0017B9DE21|nr:YsnF/AvaK domain-containing protein [Methylibium sp.]MBA3596929.1 YsnF/AvaK domain-containing protein [Methylibium sp.]
MASTVVVGIFDEYSEAKRACEKLEAMGIDLQNIQVNSSASGEDHPSLMSSHKEHEGGIRGFFASLFGSDESDDSSSHYSEAVRRGSAVVTVNLDDDGKLEAVSEVLEDCGAIDVDERVRHWQSSGYTGYDESAQPFTSEDAARERQKLQVVQEDLKVGKREVGRGGVRVHRHVSETPVEEQVTLREQHAVVDRKRVDRPATNADLADMGEANIEIRETTEEPVVSKTARVVEEVSVGKKASQHTETIRDKVRRADVDVERLDDGAESRRSPMATHLRDDAAMGSRTPGMAEMGTDLGNGYTGPERRRQRGGRNPVGIERRAGM